jgi:hypothetical protein
MNDLEPDPTPPGFARPPTPYDAATVKTWMPGTRPSMTIFMIALMPIMQK